MKEETLTASLPDSVRTGALADLLKVPVIPGASSAATPELQYIDHFLRSAVVGCLPNTQTPGKVVPKLRKHNRGVRNVRDVTMELQNRVYSKILVLDNRKEFSKPAKPAAIGSKRRKRRLVSITAKKRRQYRPRHRTVTKYDCRFSTAQCLVPLWQTYIAPLTKDVLDENLPAALAHADLHGAEIRVVATKEPEKSEVEGIVIQETRQSFIVVTPHDKCVALLKTHTTIALTLPDGRIVHITKHVM